MSDNTVLSQVLNEQVSKMKKSLDEFSRVCSNAIDVYTQSNEDTISRQAALNSPVTMVSEGLDWIPAYHIKGLPSAQPEPTAGDCWGCNCPKMNTKPKITFEALQSACKYRRVFSIKGRGYEVDCFYEDKINECKQEKCPLLNQHDTEEL